MVCADHLVALEIQGWDLERGRALLEHVRKEEWLKEHRQLERGQDDDLRPKPTLRIVKPDFNDF